MDVVAICQNTEFVRGFEVLHRSIETADTEITVKDIKKGMAETHLPINEGGASLLLIDLIKRTGSSITDLLEAQFPRAENDASGVLVVGRVAFDEPIVVQDVLNGQGVLPSFSQIRLWCLDRGLQGAYLLLDDFDRKFFPYLF